MKNGEKVVEKRKKNYNGLRKAHDMDTLNDENYVQFKSIKHSSSSSSLKFSFLNVLKYSLKGVMPLLYYNAWLSAFVHMSTTITYLVVR